MNPKLFLKKRYSGSASRLIFGLSNFEIDYLGAGHKL
jgi:hypothetical protein